MAGDLEMSGGEGSGNVEVGGRVANLDGETDALFERSPKEAALEVVVVEQGASSSTDIAIAEKHGKRKPLLNRHNRLPSKC